MGQKIISVGLDIGTSTTQLVISELILADLAGQGKVPSVEILTKEIKYRSKIYFTPLQSSDVIDGPAVREIVSNEYKLAGIEKKDIQSGAVIITGEAARKKNSKVISYHLADLIGEFVVATAGPDLESVIAGMGSGACRLSKENSEVIANFDIGGGTSNIAVFQKGELIDTACLNIGGRLIKFDDENRISYISKYVKEIAASLNLSLGIGDSLTDDGLQDKIKKIVEQMVQCFLELLGFKPQSDICKSLLVGSSLKNSYQLDKISFSGGVGEYFYAVSHSQRKEFNDLIISYGDIGPLLALAIKDSELKKRVRISRVKEKINATVIGAGLHVTRISGSTITYTENSLPQKNIPLIKLFTAETKEDLEGLGWKIRQRLQLYNFNDEKQRVALALKGPEVPSFSEVTEYARQITTGLREYIQAGLPVIIVLEHDFAKALGQVLRGLLGTGYELVCIDGINVNKGDYIDIGKPLSRGIVLPVIIKTLIFE